MYIKDCKIKLHSNLNCLHVFTMSLKGVGKMGRRELLL